MEDEVTPRDLDAILDEYRNARPGGHVVGGRALRQMVGEIDRLRGELDEQLERCELEPGVMLEVVREAGDGR